MKDANAVEKTGQDIDAVMAKMNLTPEQQGQLKAALKSEGRSRRMSATEIEAKYKHVVKGSVRFDATANKQKCTITCTNGTCKKTRDVFTSDLFQVETCTDCKAEARKKDRDAQKKLLADFKAKQEEAAKASTPAPDAPEGEVAPSEEEPVEAE